MTGRIEHVYFDRFPPLTVPIPRTDGRTDREAGHLWLSYFGLGITPAPKGPDGWERLCNRWLRRGKAIDASR